MKELNQSEEIKNLWKIKVVGPKSIVELRAIKGREIITKLFNGRTYQSVDELRLAIEHEALRLNVLIGVQYFPD